eukprot:GHRQ01005886.1.p1 GENE.GHRQ01005886.1~~GHRQ01005886.1.p1  ORF type:complete len:195 (+),score=56.26 GHRQ01005886.1:319-903(+)
MQQQRTLSTHQSTGSWTRDGCGALRPFGSHILGSRSIKSSTDRLDRVVDVAERQPQPETGSSSTGQQHQQQLLLSTDTSSSMQPCRRKHRHSSNWMVLPAVAMHQLSMSLYTPAQATESVSPAGLELFREFLDQIAALGPWGAALFVVTVMTAEMVPLFPTQPLMLASGLLFGPVKVGTNDRSGSCSANHSHAC